MSIEGKVVDAPRPPDDPQGLQQEIERTREHLGETVEALMAKVDVKARAQDEAGRLIRRLKGSVVRARAQAVTRAARARREVVDKTAGTRQQATAQGRHVRRQVAGQATGPLQQAAGNAAATARSRRTPLLAAVGAIGAGLVGWLLFQRWRRRG